MRISAPISTLFAFLFFVGTAFAQKPEPEIYKGNEWYRKQQYDKARQEYEQALSKDPNNPIAHYNSASAAFRQNKFDEAIKSLDNTISNSNDKKLQQQAYYNKGVALARQQKLEESIEAWKQALKMNQDDQFTRENLEKALRELKKKQQQEQQQKKQKKDQKKQQKNEKEQPQKQPKLSQQRVEQLLRALQQKEKEVNDKLNQNRVASPTKPDKDW